MKTQAELLRDEILRVIDEQNQSEPDSSPEFAEELIARVVRYVHQQRARGITVAQCAQELSVSKNRLHYWLYQRARLSAKETPAPALRPVVQVASEMVPVYDGVPERRYVMRSPAGWELRELTMPELVELLRSLV